MEMGNFRYGEKSYDYSVKHSSARKKTVSIHVLPDAAVEVIAPPHATKEKILATLKKRARWVARNVDQIHEHQSYVLPREYVSGETHFYLGRRYQLKVIPSDCNQVKLQRGSFYIETERTDSESVQLLLHGWYLEHARQLFQRRMIDVVRSVPWVDEQPAMTVRLMAKQWGSCSPKGRISLNWNLVKAPVDCVDYVITHELCHLQEHNHSKKFYALMDKCYPDWRPVKTKLDAMAEMLLNE